jgi:hypothetical protein
VDSDCVETSTTTRRSVKVQSLKVAILPFKT